MKAVRVLQSSQITCAITQVVGELTELGQEVRISDIAAFLGCTKATARRYLNKALWSEKLQSHCNPYRGSAVVYTYTLGKRGKVEFNSDNYKSAKKSVLEIRGVV